MASTTRADRRRAQAIAAEALRQAAAAGITLPPDLRLWSLAADGRPAANGDGSPGAETGHAGTADHGPAAVGEPDGGSGAGDGLDGLDLVGDGCDARGLAAVLEAVTPPEQRQANGLHVTPGWLADEVVALALDGLDVPPRDLTVCDPACGGGAFLVSAAEALHARGVPRRQVVRHLVWGADVDAVGLAAAEVALALWAGEAPPPGRLVTGDPLVRGEALWPDRPAGGFGAVVGNPPFLNQLGRATVRPAELTRRLRRRFGPAVRPYTDTAWLFLLLGCELVRDRGRVTMVQPLSLVAARDAAVVREALDHQATLRHLWVERRRSFAAGVKVCAPVLEVHHRVDPAARRAEPAAGRSWADHLADAMGVPPVDVPGRQRLGDRATVLAGFRDEYYGLVPLVREAHRREADGEPASAVDGGVPGDVDGGAPGDEAMDGDEADDERPLITAGVVDWGRCAWGERPSRFAKRQWVAPVVDLVRQRGQSAAPAGGTGGAGGAGEADGDEVDDVGGADESHDADRAEGDRDADQVGGVGELARDAARWVARTSGPKVVVATQTRVVEAAVDERGRWVPSVPALAVLPHDPDDLWRLAAALSAPTATAWLLRRAPETGLSRGALKIAARDLADLPLPEDGSAWTAAATALRAYARAPSPEGLDAFARAAAEAYRAPPALLAWWRDRLPPLPVPGRPPAGHTGPTAPTS